MKAYRIGGAAAAIAIATAAAAAQTAPPAPPGVAQGTAPAPRATLPPPGAPHVRVMFGGDDHVMTRAEVADHVGKLFARLDTNHDGFVTRAEAEALHQKMEAAMARAGDAEKRVGEIQEHLAQRGVFFGDKGAMFDRLDTNHDGNISRQEFMASTPGMREQRVMVMNGGPGGAPGAPMDGHMGMGMHMHDMGMHGVHAMRGMSFMGPLFDMADANHDGRVSLAEAQAAALAHFDKADLNHDGRITPDERGQMRETIRSQRRQG